MESPTANPERATYTAGQLARLLGVSETHIRNLARRHEMPGARQLGRRWVFSKQVIDAWLATDVPDAQRRAQV
jgi:excisionase family DNA binding protein